jgi:hypothetical protein
VSLRIKCLFEFEQKTFCEGKIFGGEMVGKGKGNWAQYEIMSHRHYLAEDYLLLLLVKKLEDIVVVKNKKKSKQKQAVETEVFEDNF